MNIVFYGIIALIILWYPIKWISETISGRQKEKMFEKMFKESDEERLRRFIKALNERQKNK
jgi:hypothetical protein